MHNTKINTEYFNDKGRVCGYAFHIVQYSRKVPVNYQRTKSWYSFFNNSFYRKSRSIQFPIYLCANNIINYSNYMLLRPSNIPTVYFNYTREKSAQHLKSLTHIIALHFLMSETRNINLFCAHWNVRNKNISYSCTIQVP